MRENIAAILCIVGFLMVIGGVGQFIWNGSILTGILGILIGGALVINFFRKKD